MTIVVLAAVGCGIGCVGLILAVRRSAPSLETQLARLLGHGSACEALASDTTVAPGWRVDRRAGSRLAASGLERIWLRPEVRSAMVLTGVSLNELCSQIVLAGVVGLLLPSLSYALLKAGGLGLPVVTPVAAGIVGAVAGGVLTVIVMAADAKKCRRRMRRGVGAFLNLVVLCLAGGMGLEGSLVASAGVSDDEVFKRIDIALALAVEAGDRPWDALARLGHDLGVAELEELASAVQLAGTEGARIRATLEAKAHSIRKHELTEMEAQANAVTERLFFPGALMLIGFLIFIGYPAMARISLGF